MEKVEPKNWEEKKLSKSVLGYYKTIIKKRFNSFNISIIININIFKKITLYI